ncbi:MAG: peptide chain release factor N(5)-glutamine methyltransferase [Candidatus Zixiibacteriota bacterium]
MTTDLQGRSTPTSIPKLMAEKAHLLEVVGIDQASAEIELILCHLLDVDRVNLYLHGSELLNEDVHKNLDAIIEQRRTRYPLQYILGESWFYGRRFEVSDSVMAPTPETELLCESAIRFVRVARLQQPRIVDLGIGSGVIAVTLACELSACRIVGLDISEEALAVARSNLANHHVSKHIELRQSDYFSSVLKSERFDLILSNPPYIAEGDYPTLDPEVLADPKIAMTAGDDGLDAVRVILRDAPNFLAPGGRIMFEIGAGQSQAVSDLTEKDSRYTSIVILKDLNDIDRIVILECD